jgi:hypothetical protein
MLQSVKADAEGLAAGVSETSDLSERVSSKVSNAVRKTLVNYGGHTSKLKRYHQSKFELHGASWWLNRCACHLI